MSGLREEYTGYVALPAMMTSTPTRERFEIDLLFPCELILFKVGLNQSHTWVRIV